MSPDPLRLVFAGTPEFAAVHLRALLDSEHRLLAVYTQPDRPAGRGRKLQASPVKQLAVAAGLPVHQPASLKSPQEQAQLADLAADLMVVVAYGLILPAGVLAAPRLGCVNVHASLLPRWRGAAPIQRAIEAGDTETGITIMQMDAGLDTGAMLATARLPLAGHSAASLLDALAGLGPPLLLDVLAQLPRYQQRARPQDDRLATYAAKISKDEGRIDWRRDAAALERSIRAFNPFPVCYASLHGERIRVLEAQLAAAAPPAGPPGTIIAAGAAGIVVQCGSGAIALRTLQLPGGRALTAEQLLAARSERFAAGARFDCPAT